MHRQMMISEFKIAPEVVMHCSQVREESISESHAVIWFYKIFGTTALSHYHRYV